MATTSPDNIYSPDPNTLYNFVTDLRNMAVSIQTALSRRVSGLRGTTAEMNAALSSSPLEATWFNTTNNLWYTKSATAWVESGPNVFRGPTSAMNAYPNPKSGMAWWDTTTGTLMWRTSVAWRPYGYVLTQAERDAVVPSPVLGSTVFRMDLGYSETYYTLYNASTNPLGTVTAGWYGVPVSSNVSRAKVFGDTGWWAVGSGPIALAYRPGISALVNGPWNGVQYRLFNGTLYVAGACQKSSAIQPGEAIINVPADVRPSVSQNGNAAQYYTTATAIVFTGGAGNQVSFGINFPVG